MIKGFLRSYERFPQKTALIVHNKEFTFEWVYKQAADIAATISSVSKEEHFIGLYTDNNECTYAGLLGILMAGKGFVPLNHKFPDERLKKIISDAGIKHILHCSSSESRVQEILSNSSIVADKEKVKNTVSEFKVDDEKIAYILFTSGSTGIPKGIPITHLNFNSLIQALDKRYSLTENDKVLQAFELSFDVSLACIFIAWEYGCALVVPDLNGIVAVNAFKAIYDHQVNFVTLPPSAIFYLKKLKVLGYMKVPFVHTTLFTGEALPMKLVTEWKTSAENTIVENAYGPTETTVWSLFYKLDDTTPEQTINGLCPIGECLDDINYKIVDDKMNDLPDRERGELLVEGKQIFHGYWNDPKKTKEVLHEDSAGKKWYKTGDIVVRNTSGNIVYINRKDNQVQVNGYRVELGEVEHALKQVTGIDGVVVLAKSTEDKTELFAFIESEITNEVLNARLKEKLPFYMIPRQYFHVSPLPVNTNGKIDKQLLAKQFLS